MIRTLALVTRKGGSGKSTLAACLAVAAQAAGERVCVLDGDPQASLHSWALRRADPELRSLRVTAGELGGALEVLGRSARTLVIIDTPGAETAMSDRAMMLADFVLLPARPTIFDIWAASGTCARLRELDRRFAFVLNQCPTFQASQRVIDGATALEQLGALVQPMIASRVLYQEVAYAGRGVTEIEPRGKAAEEIHALWASINRRLQEVLGGTAQAAE